VNSPAGEAASLGDGLVFAGGLGTRDARAYVTIAGRKAAMIISGGESIHPVQVAEVLNEHPLISESIVVGLPGERWGEVVAASVVPAGAGLAAADCDRHCREHPVPSNCQRPRGCRFVTELARNRYRQEDAPQGPRRGARLPRPRGFRTSAGRSGGWRVRASPHTQEPAVPPLIFSRSAGPVQPFPASWHA
jgi:hypothetical protein